MFLWALLRLVVEWYCHLPFAICLSIVHLTFIFYSLYSL